MIQWGRLLVAALACIQPLHALAETRDRVDDAALQARIESAADLVDSGHVLAAKQQFSAILARDAKTPGFGQIEELDLTTAFGVELCANGYPTASLPYLRRVSSDIRN